jgi:SAM-dependent methyltransferase
MLPHLTPARRRGVELLDDPATPGEVRERAMMDVMRANALFGGTRAVLSTLARVLPTLPRGAVLLDVGTGLGDIPSQARRAASRAGVTLTTFGLDVPDSLLRSARGRLNGVVAGDARHLPVLDDSVDIVTCSQLLHHFVESDARRVIAELHRVSRGWVVIGDLRRSWFAAGGFWLASTALRFHPVTRGDGVTSVLRGFTARELETLVLEVTGARPVVRHGVFWRLSATWTKSGR